LAQTGFYIASPLPEGVMDHHPRVLSLTLQMEGIIFFETSAFIYNIMLLTTQDTTILNADTSWNLMVKWLRQRTSSKQLKGVEL
jgi:hypothetical protein